MSRIYDNKPLSALPVDSVSWKEKWSQERYQNGLGVLIECCLKSRSRHLIADTEGTKTRYVALHLSVRRAHKRRFDSKGVEIEPNFGETEKVRTGYLNSSYKTVAKGQDDAISQCELERLIQPPELLKVTERHRQPGCITLWISEVDLQGTEMEINNTVRIRTKGDGPFVESITRLDAETTATTVCNYSGGEQVGSTWTDKIMAVKAAAATDEKTVSVSNKPGEGAADDEWDD